MQAEPKTRKGQNTKNKMIEVAAQLIHKNGVTATTVNDVLEQSKTGKSQFSHYFGSKEALISGVIEYHREHCIREIEARVALVRSLDDLPELCEFFKSNAERFLKNNCGGCPIGQMTAEVSGENTEIQTQLAAIFDILNLSVANKIRELQAAGQINSQVDADRVAEFFNCVLQGGYVLSKSRQDINLVNNCLQHLTNYLETLAN